MLQIHHDSRAHRLLVELEGQTGLLEYELDNKVMSITHTRVPRPIGGRRGGGGINAQCARFSRCEPVDREARMLLCRGVYEQTALGPDRHAS
jgi:hypothetical protein